MTKKTKQILKDLFLFIVSSLAVVGIHYLVNPSDLAMSKVNPNPLVVISVLFSAYRGVKFAFLCSTFSALLYFGLFLAQVDFQAVEDIYSLEFIMLPILIIFTSVLVGDLQQRARDKIEDLKIKVDEKKLYFQKIQDKQSILEKENFHLKKRIVTKIDTIKDLHQAALKLNSLDVDQLTNNFIEVVKSNIEIKSAAFFAYDSESGELSISAPSDFDETELEGYCVEKDPLVISSIQERTLLTVKDILLREKAHSVEKGALLSAPVFKEGEVYGVFIILKMPFLEFVPQTINIIKELVLWYEESLNAAVKYQIINTSSDADFRYKAYKYKYFKQRLSEELSLAQKYSIPLHVLKISMTNLHLASTYRGHMLKKFVVEYLRTRLSLLDSVCLGEVESEILVIFFDTKSAVVEKANDINKGLERFNLSVNNKNKLEINYYIADKKTGSSKIIEVLESFEKVS